MEKITGLHLWPGQIFPGGLQHYFVPFPRNGLLRSQRLDKKRETSEQEQPGYGRVGHRDWIEDGM